jgi:hypothetical protein
MRGKVPIYTLIGDDDSTLTANMKHSMKARVAANLMDPSEWPRGNPTASNPRGAKKPLGILSVWIAEIETPLTEADSFLAMQEHLKILEAAPLLDEDQFSEDES